MVWHFRHDFVEFRPIPAGSRALIYEVECFVLYLFICEESIVNTVQLIFRFNFEKSYFPISRWSYHTIIGECKKRHTIFDSGFIIAHREASTMHHSQFTKIGNCSVCWCYVLSGQATNHDHSDISIVRKIKKLLKFFEVFFFFFESVFWKRKKKKKVNF